MVQPSVPWPVLAAGWESGGADNRGAVGVIGAGRSRTRPGDIAAFGKRSFATNSRVPRRAWSRRRSKPELGRAADPDVRPRRVTATL